MQNMKLLDLQTGKYLELGKDWLYGGEFIIVNICKIGYSIYEAIQHKDSEKFFMYDEDCPFTDEPQEPLKTLCKETGAVVYGGGYVLITTKNGIFCENGCYVLYLKGERIRSLTTETTDYYQKYKQLPTEDILPFEKYSKSLRGEENELNKLMELLK